MSDLPVPAETERRAANWLHRLFARRTAAAIDIALLKLMMGDEKLPSAADLRQLTSEVADTHEHYQDHGFLHAPHRFHRTPEPPATLEVSRGWHPTRPRLVWERVRFPSGYVPEARPEYRDRWLNYEENRTAHAAMLRHKDDRDRPWLVCLHGLGTGSAWMDFPAFRAGHLHKKLGLNLIMPVLPLHGRRRAPGMERSAMVSFRLLDTLHGLAQAVWDTRRIVSWLRAQGVARIGLFGLSLGAYTASVTAGLEPCELVVAGIPVADIPELFAGHTPADLEERIGVELPTEQLTDIFSVVSPHRFVPLTPHDRRFIFAGAADHITPPPQARLMWEAWERPTLQWFDGGHVSAIWSKAVAGFVDDLLWQSGFTTGALPPAEPRS